MKVLVDWNSCDGNGNCAAAAPEIFSLGEDDKLSLLMNEIPATLRSKAETAVRACPKRALRLIVEDSK